MKPLGVVLLFLNLLAGAGVVYLATQDWTERQKQNTALLKHELAISGLPLEKPKGNEVVDPGKPDESLPFAATPAPGRRTTDIRASVLVQLFEGTARQGEWVGGMSSAPPPLSVMGEVEAVKKEIDGRLAGFAGKPLQGVAFLIGTPGAGGVLTPGPLVLLADDFEERFTCLEWLAEAAKPAPPGAVVNPADEFFALARAALDRRFAEVLDQPNPDAAKAYETEKQERRAARNAARDEWLKAPLAQVKARREAYDAARLAYWKAMAAKTAGVSDGDRRLKAAGLLCVLDPSEGGQKRTALTVGLAEYTAAVLDRTQRLSDMPDGYQRQYEIEVKDFEVVYNQKLAAARDLDRMLHKQKGITAGFLANQKVAAAQVEMRTKHRDGAKGRTDDMAAKVAAAAAAQEGLEVNIFELQQLAGARFAELFELEAKVIEAEKLKAGK